MLKSALNFLKSALFHVFRFVWRCMKFVYRYFRKRIRLTNNYKFIDRKKNSDTVLIILAGYKSFVWDSIFERVEKFVPKNIDVCICSSGLYNEKLASIAAKNNWSYLSTNRNNVALVQNVAIKLHEKAKWIYKMDEDIFVTNGVFEILKQTYEKALDEKLYEPGFVAPLIPVNVYGHVRVLDKLGLLATYEKMFEKTGYTPFQKLKVWRDPEVAKFFWGNGNFVPSIDDMAIKFKNNDKIQYRACPIRFSVGFVMFSRKYWQNLGMFEVGISGVGMGVEEVQMCNRSTCNSEAIIVSENSVVGHLSFGPQNKGMKEYYLSNPEKFSFPNS